jgi:hypothetical protein
LEAAEMVELDLLVLMVEMELQILAAAVLVVGKVVPVELEVLAWF